MFWLLACSPAHSESPAPVEEVAPVTHAPLLSDAPVPECADRIAPGEPLASHLDAGGVVCLAAGEHRGNWTLPASVTLVGEPGTVLVGAGAGPVLTVVAHKLEVRLVGVQLRGGVSDLGGGLLLSGYSRVSLEQCTLTGNEAGAGGGAGAAATGGFLELVGCRSDDEVLLTNLAQLDLVDTVLEGDLQVLDGAVLRGRGGQVKGTLTLRGTTSRRPAATLTGTELGVVDNHPTLSGTLTR